MSKNIGKDVVAAKAASDEATKVISRNLVHEAAKKLTENILISAAPQDDYLRRAPLAGLSKLAIHGPSIENSLAKLLQKLREDSIESALAELLFRLQEESVIDILQRAFSRVLEEFETDSTDDKLLTVLHHIDGAMRVLGALPRFDSSCLLKINAQKK